MDSKTLRQLPEEELRDKVLDSLSDAVRDIAHRITMLKAIAKAEYGIKPEDFDTALENERSKEWEKVKDKTSHELAVMGMLEMMASGMTIEEVFGEDRESEEE